MTLLGCSSELPQQALTNNADNHLGTSQLAIVQVGTTNLDCSPLIAGQTIEVGEVCAEVSSGLLSVTYNLVGEWTFVETQLWVGTNLQNMPQTNTGSPKIGNFPFKSEDVLGETSWSIQIPLEDLVGFDGMETSCDPLQVLLAAHATVRLGPEGSETAWADGINLLEQGSWATYWSFELTCEEPVAPPSSEQCETAFAFTSDDQSFCSNDITGNGRLETRWGWFGELAPGTYEFDLYAGAGRCDLSKGTLVGMFELQYDGASSTGTFWPEASFTVSTSHLYLAHSMLEKLSPGQFSSTVSGDNLSETTHIIGGLDGASNIYFSAHAEVCGL